MDKLAGLMNAVSKSYLYTHLAKDIGKFVRRNLTDVDFDKEHWLHKAGLQPYHRGGGFFLFCAGVLAGAGVALAMAPKPGRELRTQVKDRAMELFNRGENKAVEAATTSLS
jgi:hypothetical protein